MTPEQQDLYNKLKQQEKSDQDELAKLDKVLGPTDTLPTTGAVPGAVRRVLRGRLGVQDARGQRVPDAGAGGVAAGAVLRPVLRRHVRRGADVTGG